MCFHGRGTAGSGVQNRAPALESLRFRQTFVQHPAGIRAQLAAARTILGKRCNDAGEFRALTRRYAIAAAMLRHEFCELTIGRPYNQNRSTRSCNTIEFAGQN